METGSSGYNRMNHSPTNPLRDPLLALLEQHPEGIGEHEVIKALADSEPMRFLKDTGSLALFRKHFLVMNGLYQLREQLWRDQRRLLEISPLKIQLGTTPHGAPSGENQLQTETDPLSDYYLDWHNFDSTTEQDVDDLLNAFWQRFTGIEARAEALELLQLDADASEEQITQRYRSLVAQHHPDKGGDADTFIRLRKAYEHLVGKQKVRNHTQPRG
jgi:DnaJ-domain-containing protein 1